jgi:hypothetical protein
VALAVATEGDADSVTLLTEFPKVIVLVVSGVPVLAPPTLANGEMVMLLEDEPVGLVPAPVMVTVAPAGIDELRPKVITLLLVPDGVALLTVAVVAVPPDGVKVTE